MQSLGPSGLITKGCTVTPTGCTSEDTVHCICGRELDLKGSSDVSGKLQELQYFGVFILNGFVSVDLIVSL